MKEVPFYLAEIKTIDPSVFEEKFPFGKPIRMLDDKTIAPDDTPQYDTAPYELRTFKVREGKYRIQTITILVSRVMETL